MGNRVGNFWKRVSGTLYPRVAGDSIGVGNTVPATPASGSTALYTGTISLLLKDSAGNIIGLRHYGGQVELSSDGGSTWSPVLAGISLEWQNSIKDKDLTAPPAATAGDRYIVASVATGVWATKEKAIAQYVTGTTWTFTTPNEGFALWVDDEDCVYVYSGTAWAKFGTFIAHSNLTGLTSGDDHTQYIRIDQTSPQSIGATGTRATAGWFTDLAVTNAIAGSVTGTAAGAALWGLYSTITGPTQARTFTLPDASTTILTTNAAITAPQGGTGQSSYTVGDLLYASTTSALSTRAAVAVGSVLVSAGTNTAPAWSASPTLTTSLTVPTILAPANSLVLKPTTDAVTAILLADQDGNAVLSVDTTNNRVGVMTAAPGYALDVTGTFHSSGTAYFDNSINLVGTLNAPANDGVITILSRSYTVAKAAAINVATGTWTNTDGGTSQAVAIKPVYNQASGAASNTDLLINRTETAVGSGAQYLINAGVGGGTFVSKFAVSNVGLITVSGVGTHTFTGGANSDQLLQVTNTTSGTSATSLVGFTAGTTVAYIGATSQAYTAATIYPQAGVYLESRGVGGINIAANNASGEIKLFAGGTTEHLRVSVAGNLGLGVTAFGTNATKALGIGTGVAPTTAPADMIQIYSEDVGVGQCVFSVMQEYAPYAGVGVASTHKIPVRFNGTTYYVLATTVQ